MSVNLLWTKTSDPQILFWLLISTGPLHISAFFFLNRYEAEETGALETDGKYYSIVFYIEEEVEVTQSMFAIEPLTLLTRIGGILGVGRTIVWLINLCFDNFIVVHSVFFD